MFWGRRNSTMVYFHIGRGFIQSNCLLFNFINLLLRRCCSYSERTSHIHHHHGVCSSEWHGVAEFLTISLKMNAALFSWSRLSSHSLLYLPARILPFSVKVSVLEGQQCLPLPWLDFTEWIGSSWQTNLFWVFSQILFLSSLGYCLVYMWREKKTDRHFHSLPTTCFHKGVIGPSSWLPRHD